MIRDGNAVSVAAEIAQHLQRSAEGRLGVDDPVLAAQTAYQLGKLLGLAEDGRRSGMAEFLASIEMFQSVDKLATENTPQRLDRQKEPLTRTHPALMIGREPSGRN